MALPIPPDESTPAAAADNEAPEDAPTRPHLRQLAVQCAAALIVLSLAWPYYGLRNETLPWPETTLAIGAVALVIASLTRQAWWWRLIHALFAPLAGAVAAWSIAPGWFLLAFMLMWLVYRGALGGQIPLYLSNAATARAIEALCADRAGMRFLDLGAGIASVLRRLAQARPDGHFAGIENAPATWLIGYLRTRGLGNCTWRWGDIWSADLANCDVVYAFLSPAAMPALWEKVEREMRPGSLFVSNSFAVPSVEASHVIEVGDTRQTRLYCYRR